MQRKPIKNEIKLIISFWLERVQSVFYYVVQSRNGDPSRSMLSIKAPAKPALTTQFGRGEHLKSCVLSYLPWIFLKFRIKISLYVAFFGTNTTFPFESWIRRFYQPLKGQLLLINWAEVTELVAHQQSQRYRLVCQTHRWRKTKETKEQRDHWTITKPEYGLTKQSKTSQRHKENSPATK